MGTMKYSAGKIGLDLAEQNCLHSVYTTETACEMELFVLEGIL